MSYKVCLAAVGRPRVVISITAKDTLEDLYRMASEEFGQCQLKSGFPPKLLESSVSVSAQSVVRANDRVTVIPIEPDRVKTTNSARGKAKTTKHVGDEGVAHDSGAKSSPNEGRPKRAAAQIATDSFSDIIKAQDRLERQEKGSKKRKQQSSTFRRSGSVAQAKASTSRKLAKMEGRRLGDGAKIVPSTGGGTKRPRAVNSMKNENDVSFALLNALDSGGGGKVGQVLRGAMRNAITRQYDTSRAVVRVSAVQAGRFRVQESHGKLHVDFDKGVEGRGQYTEVVDHIPREALSAVVCAIHASDSESLRPATLSHLSPRVFWSVLHCTKDAGYATSVEEALKRLVPSLDWSFLRRRKQTLSEKAKENLRQERLQHGEEEKDLEKAEKAVQAVEHAMDQLHQYSLSERRVRAANAAIARQSDAWELATPLEVDEDELKECVGEEAYISKLMQRGINNWRMLANVTVDELAWTKADREKVEHWVDKAQERSIEEIIVEICDNRTEVVEALRDQARSGTPKDLANWTEMPNMLFSAAPALKVLNVEVEDIARWCQRAKEILNELEWTQWYATPVE